MCDYTLSFAVHVLGLCGSILSVCGKNWQKKVFLGDLAGVSSRQPDPGSGARVRLLGRFPFGTYGGYTVLGAQVLGFL